MTNSLLYFDAIFYIQKKEDLIPAFTFPEVPIASNGSLCGSNPIIRKLTLTANQLGEFDYQKPREIVLSKAMREGFQKVLVIYHFLENHGDELQEHLDFMVEEMSNQAWSYWQIESLSETVLTSEFKNVYMKKSEAYFAYAFNTAQQYNTIK